MYAPNRYNRNKIYMERFHGQEIVFVDITVMLSLLDGIRLLLMINLNTNKQELHVNRKTKFVRSATKTWQRRYQRE